MGLVLAGVPFLAGQQLYPLSLQLRLNPGFAFSYAVDLMRFKTYLRLEHVH